MAEFKNAPVATLATMDEVREAMTMPRKSCCGFTGLDIYRIKSTWLVGLIDEIAASGEFPYNATVKKLAEERLGLPPKSDAEYAHEGDVLSLLIYNAQCYRSSDRLVAHGYEPFTADVLKRAYAEKKGLEMYSSGLMGSSVIRLNVRKIGDELYAMRPKKRRMYVGVQGQPVRLVA